MRDSTNVVDNDVTWNVDAWVRSGLHGYVHRCRATDSAAGPGEQGSGKRRPELPKQRGRDSLDFMCKEGLWQTASSLNTRCIVRVLAHLPYLAGPSPCFENPLVCYCTRPAPPSARVDAYVPSCSGRANCNSPLSESADYLLSELLRGADGH